MNGQISDMGVGKPCVTRRGVTDMDWDTVGGMFFSQVIMFFIIVTTAATLHAGGITTIQTASQAAEALQPLAGDLAYLLFAAGIIGTGLLAVPVLAGASAYAVAETAGTEGGAGQESRPSSWVLRGNRRIYTDRHVPGMARDQPYNSSLLRGRVEWSGCTTADGAGHHDCKQEGHNGPVRQFEGK